MCSVELQGSEKEVGAPTVDNVVAEEVTLDPYACLVLSCFNLIFYDAYNFT